MSPDGRGCPTVSVLLVSWNRREETRRCLDALRATTGAVRYEVVAVDNASTDGSADLLAADPVVRLIRNPRNVGLAAAVNQAYRQAAGQLILLLDSAVIFQPGALDAMVGFLRDRADAAAVSPLYLGPDSTIQQYHTRLPTLTAALAMVTAVRRLPGFRSARDRSLAGQDLSRPRELASGTCMLIRRTVLEPDQILDERFPIYWNDAVLARRLQLAGHRLWTTPGAVVTHTRATSPGRLPGTPSRARHFVGGLVCYLRLTQPRYRLEVFRSVLLAEHAVRRLCRRPTPLGLRDLTEALRGEVGPLPDGDRRQWSVLSGDGQSAAEHYFRALVGGYADDQRTLLIDRPRRLRGWRPRVHFDGSSVWRITPPALLPVGWRLAAVRAVNRRFAAGVVRRWLDDRPGVRVLRLDDTSRYLVGRIGEDEVVGATSGALELSRG